MKRSEAPEVICVSDAETTGVDITEDCILTFYALIQDIKGETIREESWTIDPGIEVPKGASDVHGMTTEWIREHGRKDAAKAIQEIAMFHVEAIRMGCPIIGFNHSFDLGLLDQELKRHYGEGLITASEFRRAHYFDPSVYDRTMDKWRPGGRKLFQVAEHYGIAIDQSRLHEAKYDVEVTAKLAWILFKKSPYTVAQLQKLQVQWKDDWAKGLTKHFAKIGQTEEDGSAIVVDGSFPWRQEAPKWQTQPTRS